VPCRRPLRTHVRSRKAARGSRPALHRPFATSTDLERWETEDAELVVVAYGVTARPALGAVRRLRARGMAVEMDRLRTELARLGAQAIGDFMI
jgi:pyruvate/2-oxoacid:ferredoxin oxidoreductase alpha subunit